MKKIIILVFTLVLVASSAFAENAQLDKYRDTVFAEIMNKRTEAMQKLLPCKNKILEIKRTEYQILTPVDFTEGSEHPKSGAWFEFVEMNICEEHRKTKYLVMAQNGNEPRLNLMLPGDSQADPFLQRDAMQHALIASMQAPDLKNCRDGKIVDTKFVNKDASGPWYEDWTVKGCGVSHLVRMSFIPDATGTTITAKLKE
jgi:hypothetical protein